MNIIKPNDTAIIFGKDVESIYKNFVGYLQKKYKFSDIYISNTFIILLSHAALEKRLEEILCELLRNKNDKKSIKIKQALPRKGFKDKINILDKLGCFRNKKMLKEKLCDFNTTRNAFGHLEPTGHKDYSKFLQSCDLSKEILTIDKYNKISRLQNILEYILTRIKNN